MTVPEDPKSIVDRIIASTHTEADIEALRWALMVSGEPNVFQLGKCSINIMSARDIQIGDQLYHGPDAKAIQRAVKRAQDAIIADAYDRALQDYFRSLRVFCASFPYLTLEDLLSGASRPLSEVYTPLRMRPTAEQWRDEEVAIADVLHQATTETGRRHAEVLTHPDVEKSILRWQQDLDAGPNHVLILGQPGAGKSTLVRQIAENAWDDPGHIGLGQPYMPMIVRLQSLALSEGASVETRLLNGLHKDSELLLQQDPPAGFFIQWSRRMNARWLLLLDGLDEVPADRRGALVQWLRHLTTALEVEGHLIVVASRPAHDPAGELGERFTAYELLPFTLKQQTQFAHSWFRDRDQAFLDELERVRAGSLGGTPLLLTIAAVIYGEDEHLPQTRAGLYERFLNIWLAEAKRRGLKNELGERLTKVARRGLEHLALRMTERPEDLSLQTLSQMAAAYLRQALALSEDEADAEGTHFVEVMGRRSGVFIRRGEIGGWVHSTFGEYLAASSLVRESQEDPVQVWRRLALNWPDKNWREVVLLAAAILSRADDFVRQILKAGRRDPLEPYIHHHLLLAAACLSESTDVERELVGETISSLEACLCSSIPLLAHEAAQRLIDVGKTHARDSVVELSLRLSSHANRWTRESAIYILVGLGASGDAAIDAYLGYIREQIAPVEKTSGPAAIGRHLVLAGIVNVLRKLKLDDERVVDTLVQLGRSGRVSVGVVRDTSAALAALGRYDLSTEIMQELLGPWATVDWKEYAARPRRAYCEFFRRLARMLSEDEERRNQETDQADLRYFLSVLDLPQWDAAWVYDIAAGRIGFYGKDVLHVAATLLGLDKAILAAQARMVAETVAQNGDADWNLVSQFLEECKPPTEQVWRQPVSSSAMATLIDGLGDEPKWVRHIAAQLLVNSSDSESISCALNHMLETGSNTRKRELGVRLLGLMRCSDCRTIRNLILILQDDPDASVRKEAALALGNIGCLADEVVDALIHAIADSDRQVRSAAAEALGSLDDAQPRVIGALIDGWRAKEPSTICTHCGAALGPEQGSCPQCRIVTATSHEAIVHTLGRIGEPTPDVIDVVISALQHPDSGIRRAAGKAVASLWTQDAQFVNESLLTALWQPADADARLEGFAEAASQICNKHLPTALIGDAVTVSEDWLSLLGHPSPLIRKTAISCLTKLQGDYPKFTSQFIALLSDEDESVRNAAYKALRMGVEITATSDARGRRGSQGFGTTDC